MVEKKAAKKEEQKAPESPHLETQQEKEDRESDRPEVAEDQRVPSDPEHFQPADVPPEPLTPYGGNKEAEEADEAE